MRAAELVTLSMRELESMDNPRRLSAKSTVRSMSPIGVLRSVCSQQVHPHKSPWNNRIPTVRF